LEPHKLEFGANIYAFKSSQSTHLIIILINPGTGHLLPIDQLLLLEPQGNLHLGSGDGVRPVHNVSVGWKVEKNQEISTKANQL
jgi:hypothetical protein